MLCQKCQKNVSLINPLFSLKYLYFTYIGVPKLNLKLQQANNNAIQLFNRV